ncbi:MAG: PQQ-binding-like beta-propeller repeat protein [Candidatus Coatesbacteria bacterium]|nr:PQQ-binding-like beta-propeller repeat protein [Candidatus Coatesbacteria bacterium]
MLRWVPSTYLIILMLSALVSVRAAEPDFLWTYEAGAWITSSPLFIGDDRLVFGCHDGSIRCIESEGSLVWTYRTENVVCASPVVLPGDRIACGSADSKLYCLTTDGGLVWSYQTEGPVYGTARALDDGRITFGSIDGNLYCLNPDGALSWSIETGSWITSRPSLRADGAILIASWDGCVYAASSEGNIIWTYDCGSPIAASIELDDTNTGYFGTLDGRLLCLDLDGRLLFEFPANDSILSTPKVLASGDIVFGTNDGTIYWLSDDGISKMTRSADDNVVAQPAVSPLDEIYVGSLDRKLYITNLRGSRIDTESFPSGIIAPVQFMGDGTPIVACLNGRIYALPMRPGRLGEEAIHISNDEVRPDRIHETPRLCRISPLSSITSGNKHGAFSGPPGTEKVAEPLSEPMMGIGLDNFRPTTVDQALFVIGCARGDLDQNHELYFQDELRLQSIDYLLNNPLEVPQFAYQIVAPLTPVEFDLQQIVIHFCEQIDLTGHSPHIFVPFLQEAPLASSITLLHEILGEPLEASDIEDLTARSAGIDADVQKAAATIVLGIASAYELRESSLSLLDATARDSLLTAKIMPYTSNYSSIAQLDNLLNNAKEVDMDGMAEACLETLGAVETAIGYLVSAGSRSNIGLPFSYSTPIGKIVLGTYGADVYGADPPNSEYLLIIDLGGDDSYIGGGIGCTQSPENGISILIDNSGNDSYTSDEDCSFGCGILGLGLLLDLAGNDTYRGADYSQGVGAFGFGMLCDLAGADRYNCISAGQGAATFGLGICYDRLGEDEFYCVSTSQGFGFIKGIGVIDGGFGDDCYFSGCGSVDFREADPGQERFDSMSQGFGWGYRNDEDRYWRSGGIGLINDGGGADIYLADYFAQGSGYWFGAGFLYDRAGDDLYLARNYVQGSGTHTAIGVLVEDGGDDEYFAWEHAQGSGLDLSVGMLIEEMGDDYYSCKGRCQGVGVKNAFGLLCDSKGSDVYVASTEHQGMGRINETRDYGNVGLLLDFSGLDHYSHHSGQNRSWTDGYLGFTIDAESGSVPWKFSIGMDMDVQSHIRRQR